MNGDKAALTEGVEGTRDVRWIKKMNNGPDSYLKAAAAVEMVDLEAV